jgi:adenosine deaminase
MSTDRVDCTANMRIPASIRSIPKVELHQHLDGSIPPGVTWRIMKRYRLNPVETLPEMRKLLQLQPTEEGSLLSYLDKFHYPMWITQFYENIVPVAEAIATQAARNGVRVLELRYAPIIHTYAGLTVRQAIRSVLSGLNRAASRYDLQVGLIIIAMRQHGPHVAKILARAGAGESQHLHRRSGVIGFDIAGAERGNPPRLFASAYEIARRGGLGLTAHAGEDEDSQFIWQAIDELGVTRIGHGCSAVGDKALLRRLARDRIVVECAPTSNYQTGAVRRGQPHPIVSFLEHGIPVAICTDNTTVSNTDQNRESAWVAQQIGEDAVRAIHQSAVAHTFIGAPAPPTAAGKEPQGTRTRGKASRGTVPRARSAEAQPGGPGGGTVLA